MRLKRTVQIQIPWYAAAIVCAFLFAFISSDRPVVSSVVDVRIVADEAESALAILARKKANEVVTDADWRRLFSSEGYVRLKKREGEMKRSFEDESFKAFLLSDALADRAALLAETLDKWKRAQVDKAALRALTYLPSEARIRAKVYPVIKPQGNSFVFEVSTDPAIFLYLDPSVTPEQFENTLSHELHHIGYGGSCPSRQTSEQISVLPRNVQHVLEWIGAFGEGFAMLAAAGGPDTHPHAVSKSEDRARWDHDVANFNEDLKSVERFFLDILEDRLNEDGRRNAGFAFFGIQGPWYTVGWKMAVTIEKSFGRALLIECMCDHRKLLRTYNEAALKHNRSSSEQLALWSQRLIEGINGGMR